MRRFLWVCAVGFICSFAVAYEVEGQGTSIPESSSSSPSNSGTSPKTIDENPGSPEDCCPDSCKTLIESLEAKLQKEFDAKLAKLRTDFEGDVNSLNERLGRLDQRVTKLEGRVPVDLRTQLTTLDDRVTALDSKQPARKGRVTLLEENVDQLESRVTRLDSNPNGAVLTLQRSVSEALSILGDIAKHDPTPADGKRHTLQLLGNMKASSNFQKEVYRNTKYRLRIINDPCRKRHVRINGVLWDVIPKKYSYVPVPPGPVTVQKIGGARLVGMDSSVRWKSDEKGFYVDFNIEKNQFVDE